MLRPGQQVLHDRLRLIIIGDVAQDAHNHQPDGLAEVRPWCRLRGDTWGEGSTSKSATILQVAKWVTAFTGWPVSARASTLRSPGDLVEEPGRAVRGEGLRAEVVDDFHVVVDFFALFQVERGGERLDVPPGAIISPDFRV